MSDTPRTDATWSQGMVSHARRLERELSAMTAEHERLRADLALASGRTTALLEQCRQRQDENEALRKGVEELRKDAERYRKIRAKAFWESARDFAPGGHWWLTVDGESKSDGLDAAVDRVIQSEKR